MSETLLERAKRRAAELGIAVVPAVPEWDPELIPDPGPIEFEPSEQDLEIDSILDGIGIVEAYTRWCNKSPLKAGKRREGLMISCPNPAHEDKNPSAWINADKGTWYCGGCAEGGDKYDIAAWKFGFDVPGYKSKDFGKLRIRMAEDYGYVVKTSLSGKEYIQKADPMAGQAILSAVAPVVPMPSASPSPAPVNSSDLQIDVEKLAPYESPIRKYMRAAMACSDAPPEFHFWNAMMMVASAAGDMVVLEDNPPVKANLFLCLVGSSGTGKSKSIRDLKRTEERVFPYDPMDPHSKGIYMMSTPSSAESLVDRFAKVEMDPNDPKVKLGDRPVWGMPIWNELSDFLSKSSRQGNPMKPTIMDILDGYGNVSITSRGSGTATAVNPFGMMMTTTQLKSIGSLLSIDDADSGFANRIIWVMGRESRPAPFAAREMDVEPLVHIFQKLRVWCSHGRRLKLDAGALARYSEWFYQEFRPAVEQEHASMLARCDLHIKKIMLILAINSEMPVITEDIVNRALGLWPYLRATYSTVEQELGGSLDVQCQEAILDALAEYDLAKVTPTFKEMYNRQLRGRFRDRNVALRAMSTLIALGEVDDILPTSKGSSAVRYRLKTG